MFYYFYIQSAIDTIYLISKLVRYTQYLLIFIKHHLLKFLSQNYAKVREILKKGN